MAAGSGSDERSGRVDWGRRGLLVEVTELLEALDRNELYLVYQPVVDLELLKVVGAECLLRWRRANGEVVSPERIVSFGESYGVSQIIARWVFKRAIEDGLEWRKKGLRLQLAVNASAEVVSHPEALDPLLLLLDASGFDPRGLTVEVTETDVIRQTDAVLETLTRLRSFGVEVAMDDFGSGNSNLDRLQNLPFTQIKIDRSIVSPSVTNLTSARLVNFAGMLGQALGLTVVAEGVEDQGTVEVLHRCRISRAQGYHFSGPVVADRLPRLVQDLDRRLGTTVELGHDRAVRSTVAPHRASSPVRRR
jgi:EAL domain-containing protein (putative c-di-GMP-specific phosphodiesterase class I)